MDLQTFTATLARLIRRFAVKLPSGAKIALMLQPTQWNAPERRYTDYVYHVLRAVGRDPIVRISCPYESQQCAPQMVEWAKANRQLLVISREIIVWEAL